MTDELEIAWAAGLFEGEGTITRCGGRPRLVVKMVDEEPVRRWSAIMGARVYGPYPPSGLGARPVYLAVIDGRRRVSSAAVDLRPWLSATRRARLDEVLYTTT